MRLAIIGAVALCACAGDRRLPAPDTASTPVSDAQPVGDGPLVGDLQPGADVGADAPTCTAATCKGCCKPDGTCVTGTADDSCGKDGAACANCTLVMLPCRENVCQGCSPDCNNKRCGASDGCGDTCKAGSGCCTPASCSGKSCGASDGCGGTCQVGSGCHLLYDDFSGTAISAGRWAVTRGGTATVTVSGGELRITLPAGAANTFADVASRTKFGANATFEARVWINGGQFFDHKGLGFADAGIGTGCGSTPGAKNAAQWRGQDDDLYRQTASAGQHSCVKHSDSYPAGWRTLRVERRGTSVRFYIDGKLDYTTSSSVTTQGMAVRFSGYTFTSGPAAAATIRVDWVRVSP